MQINWSFDQLFCCENWGSLNKLSFLNDIILCIQNQIKRLILLNQPKNKCVSKYIYKSYANNSANGPLGSLMFAATAPSAAAFIPGATTFLIPFVTLATCAADTL